MLKFYQKGSAGHSKRGEMGNSETLSLFQIKYILSHITVSDLLYIWISDVL
jgi:hypothetical protein